MCCSCPRGILGRASSQVVSAAVSYEFKLPDLGEGLTEGEVARWLVAEGDEIAEDQPLVEIQTDKTTVEIPSPAAGTVTRILVAEGEIAPVGAVLVVIGDGDAGSLRQPDQPAAPVAAPPVAPPATGRLQATPLVRRVAQELGVDLASVHADRPRRAHHRGRCPRGGRRTPPSRARGAASRCAACAGRSSSTSRARIGRSRRSPSSRSATSAASI